jgi:Zn2+/Cd2+-exporting ATPase
VVHVVVAFGTRKVHIAFDPAQTSRAALLEAIAAAGLRVVPAPAAGHDDEHEHRHEQSGGAYGHARGGPWGERSELIFSLTCGGLTGLGWALSKLALPEAVSTALWVLACGFGGWFTVQYAAAAVRARKLEIDSLMVLAAFGAALLGE